jgi:nitrate reductase gamma subunit
MAKRRIKKRKRTTSEKIFIVFSILIAISMVLGLFASFAAQPAETLPPGSSLPTHLVYWAQAAGIFS